MVPCGLSSDLDSLGGGVLEVHDPGSGRWDDGLGHHEGLAEVVVEADGDVSGELDVLALVFADGHLVGVV